MWKKFILYALANSAKKKKELKRDCGKKGPIIKQQVKGFLSN